MKYLKKLILIIFICFLGGEYSLIFARTTSSTSSTMSETECTTSAPSNVSGVKDVYWDGGGTPGNCENHRYYTSGTFTRSIDADCESDADSGCATDCQQGGFPASRTSTTLTCIRIDDNSPVLGDINISLPSEANILANNSQSTTITVNDNGAAPIKSIKAEYERASNCSDNFDLPISVSNTGTLNFNWDISEVKPNIPFSCDSNGLGGRDYILRITEVIDEATNSLSVPPYPTYTYHVYANSSVGYIGTRDISPLEQNSLQSVNNYASGQVNMPLNITLLDIYSNPIIPAPGINRTIDFHINKNNNSLYLDQYNRTGQSAVIIHNPNGFYRFSSTGANSIDTFTGMLSSDGIYPFSFRVYAPTGNSATGGIVSDIDAEYDINDITVDITDTTAGGNRVGLSINNSTINFLFNPLYQTTISGDIENIGFLEGVNQFSNINISKNFAGAPGFNVFTKFSSGITNEPNPDLTLTLSGSLQSGFESLENGTTPFNTGAGGDPYFTSTGSKQIETRLNIASGATADAITNSIFSTHIQFDLASPFGNLTVSQNSDVIGKDSYFASLSGTTTTAEGVKILGVSSSTNEKVHEIITDQITNDTHVLGNLDKAYLKQQLKKNALTFIKNITPDENDNNTDGYYKVNDLSTDKWINIDGKKIYNEKILYFGDNGGLVSIDILSGSGSVEGNKTIIIKGMDLYIKSDMYYGDKAKDTLGIIVLSDRNGNGGNIYIDPDVTNIVGTLYADKSLISAKDFNGNDTIDFSEELGGGLTQDVLKNQLHIYGSVFSENTLGGSINGICPSYITNTFATAFSNCNSADSVIRKNEAQKYDLNYLRRYFLNGNQPLNNGKVIGGGTCNPSGVCTSPNPNFMRIITDTTTDSFAGYPIVIEYNSLQQSSPPPLFSN